MESRRIHTKHSSLACTTHMQMHTWRQMSTNLGKATAQLRVRQVLASRRGLAVSTARHGCCCLVRRFSQALLLVRVRMINSAVSSGANAVGVCAHNGAIRSLSCDHCERNGVRWFQRAFAWRYCMPSIGADDLFFAAVSDWFMWSALHFIIVGMSPHGALHFSVERVVMTRHMLTHRRIDRQQASGFMIDAMAGAHGSTKTKRSWLTSCCRNFHALRGSCR
jgi:hypothetical protein